MARAAKSRVTKISRSAHATATWPRHKVEVRSSKGQATMTASYDFDLLCIGSGPAGQRAAVQAAKLGKRAALVEKGKLLGGVCLDTGTIPSKTFREAVLALTRHNDHGNSFGGAQRPTAAQLLSQVSEVVRRECEVIENQLRRNDVTLFWGEASFKDPHTVMVGSERGWLTVTAEHVAIAVG